MKIKPSNIRIRILQFLIIAILPYQIQAKTRLPGLFSNNMMFQRNQEIVVWGWADPQEQIRITFIEKDYHATAGNDSTWQIKIPKMKPGGPYEMTIAGQNLIALSNILIGDIWICSGQSNMEMPVGNVAKWYSGVLNYEEEIANANYPEIRLFKEARIVSQIPLNDCKGVWTQCTSEDIKDFAATAYFFGRKLHKELGVPIGLIDASNGGTNIDAWMSKEVLDSDDDFKPILQNFQSKIDNYPKAFEAYKKRLALHQKKVDEAKATGKPIPWREPMPPTGPGDRNTPSGLYNGMISPLMNVRITGIIWYQGENNTGNSLLYQKLFPTLIDNWRKDWGQGNFPFYFVQLAGFNTNQTWWGGSGINWVLLREAQLKTLSVPNTGMVVAADIGDANDTHAKNKQEVGRRLALWALANTYGKNIIYSGPLFESKEIKNNQIILKFKHAGSGLKPRESEVLKGFTISGIDKIFVNADAIIQGDLVIVSSKEISKPVAVRYGWEDYPGGNLYNNKNLPASPFRTDNWEINTF